MSAQEIHFAYDAAGVLYSPAMATKNTAYWCVVCRAPVELAENTSDGRLWFEHADGTGGLLIPCGSPELARTTALAVLLEQVRYEASQGVVEWVEECAGLPGSAGCELGGSRLFSIGTSLGSPGGGWRAELEELEGGWWGVVVLGDGHGFGGVECLFALHEGGGSPAGFAGDALVVPVSVADVLALRPRRRIPTAEEVRADDVWRCEQCEQLVGAAGAPVVAREAAPVIPESGRAPGGAGVGLGVRAGSPFGVISAPVAHPGVNPGVPAEEISADEPEGRALSEAELRALQREEEFKAEMLRVRTLWAEVLDASTRMR